MFGVLGDGPGFIRTPTFEKARRSWPCEPPIVLDIYNYMFSICCCPTIDLCLVLYLDYCYLFYYNSGCHLLAMNNHIFAYSFSFLALLGSFCFVYLQYTYTPGLCVARLHCGIKHCKRNVMSRLF